MMGLMSPRRAWDSGPVREVEKAPENRRQPSYRSRKARYDAWAEKNQDLLRLLSVYQESQEIHVSPMLEQWSEKIRLHNVPSPDAAEALRCAFTDWKAALIRSEPLDIRACLPGHDPRIWDAALLWAGLVKDQEFTPPATRTICAHLADALERDGLRRKP